MFAFSLADQLSQIPICIGPLDWLEWINARVITQSNAAVKTGASRGDRHAWHQKRVSAVAGKEQTASQLQRLC